MSEDLPERERLRLFFESEGARHGYWQARRMLQRAEQSFWASVEPDPSPERLEQLYLEYAEVTAPLIERVAEWGSLARPREPRVNKNLTASSTG